MTRPPLLLLLPCLLASGSLGANNNAPPAPAKEVGKNEQELGLKDASSSRTVKHEDGSYSIFEKSGDNKSMLKRTFNARSIVISITEYRRGNYGELRSCLIYDGRKNELFYVRYGYNMLAQLVEEQMFDTKTKGLVRRFLYTYDAMGNRSKPICITLVKNHANQQNAGPTAPEHDPFAEDFRRQQQRKQGQ